MIILISATETYNRPIPQICGKFVGSCQNPAPRADSL